MQQIRQLGRRRIKKNIVDYPSALSKIGQLQIRNFNYKDDSEDMPTSTSTGEKCKMYMDDSILQTGIIAQEVESIFPRCVKEGGHGIKSVKIDELIWATIKAVQELSAKVTALEAQI